MPGLRRFRRQAAVLVSWGSLHGKLRFGCRQDTAVARRVKVPRAFQGAAALDSTPHATLRERSGIHFPRGCEADPPDERRRIYLAAAEDARGGLGGAPLAPPSLTRRSPCAASSSTWQSSARPPPLRTPTSPTGSSCSRT